MRRLLLTLAFAHTVTAQAPEGGAGSIGGTVRDFATGSPLAGVTVTSYSYARAADGGLVTRSASAVSVNTDAQGRYRMGERPPGEYLLEARATERRGASQGRLVRLEPGQDVSSFDFLLKANGSISGRVVDMHKQPLSGVIVSIYSKLYTRRFSTYSVMTRTRTDDRGEYRIPEVPPGVSFYLVASTFDRELSILSDVPLDPKLRKRIPVPTYYPGTDTAAAAAALRLLSGERREGVEFVIERSPDYCIESRTEAQGRAASLQLSIEPAQGTRDQPKAFGTTGPDGRFRLCGLYPGEFRLTASLSSRNPGVAASLFGTSTVGIADSDVRGVIVAAEPGVTLPGEVVLEGDSAGETIPSKVRIGTSPLRRNPTVGIDTALSAESSVPGTFTIPGLVLDEYEVTVRVDQPGVYVRDIVYGGESVLDKPLRYGTAMSGSGLRVILARNGGAVHVKVADKEGNALAEARVAIWPSNAATEEAFAASMRSGTTDLRGIFSLTSLPPGKYEALAIVDAVDRTVESVARLWNSRGKAKQVAIPARAAVQVTLTPLSLE